MRLVLKKYLTWDQTIRGVRLALITVLLLASYTSWAGNYRTKGGALSVTFDLGPQYSFHYVKDATPYTPPNIFYGAANLTLWYKWAVGFYIRGAYAPTPKAQQVGAGLKLTVLEFSSAGRGRAQSRPGLQFLDRLAIHLVADIGTYSMAPGVGGAIYEASGMLLRGGASIKLGLTHTKLYIVATAMAGEISDNLILSPYLGLGIGF